MAARAADEKQRQQGVSRNQVDDLGAGDEHRIAGRVRVLHTDIVVLQREGQLRLIGIAEHRLPGDQV